MSQPDPPQDSSCQQRPRSPGLPFQNPTLSSTQQNLRAFDLPNTMSSSSQETIVPSDINKPLSEKPSQFRTPFPSSNQTHLYPSLVNVKCPHCEGPLTIPRSTRMPATFADLRCQHCDIIAMNKAILTVETPPPLYRSKIRQLEDVLKGMQQLIDEGVAVIELIEARALKRDELQREIERVDAEVKRTREEFSAIWSPKVEEKNWI